MAHYLLVARFTMDDIPLALLKDKSWAEKHAKDLHADPSLLTTKWKNAMDIWPHEPGGFVGAMVLHIDVMGDLTGVTFDSTEDGEVEQPPEPQPIEPEIPVPDGYIEITDPNHKLRPGVDFYLSLNFSPGEWISITETDGCLVSDWGPGWRFACPATQHPDLQGTPLPTETDELKVLREANAELQAVNAILKQDNDHLRSSNIAFGERNASSQAEIRDLHAKVAHLQAEYNRVADLNSQLERDMALKRDAGVKLATQTTVLRELNADLNHRLNATLARASQATDLESRIRRMAINFVQFHAKLRERRVWSASFAAEKQMSPAYGQALMIAETAFADLLLSFLQNFPHVQPDMPDEWQIDPAKEDDDDGTTD